jgi:hypothetical protein
MKEIDFREPRTGSEWRAQERGDGAYASIARAAAHDAGTGLPPDFADRVAAAAGARAEAANAGTWLETGLIAALLAALLLGGAALFLLTGRLDSLLRPSWPLGLAACVVVSQVLELATPRRPRNAGASRCDHGGGPA